MEYDHEYWAVLESGYNPARDSPFRVERLRLIEPVPGGCGKFSLYDDESCKATWVVRWEMVRRTRNEAIQVAICKHKARIWNLEGSLDSKEETYIVCG